MKRAAELIRHPFLLFCLSLIACTQPVFAQQEDREAVLNTAKADIQMLCSPGFAGRGYQYGGHHTAALYIAEKFAAFGLKPLPGSGKEENPYFQPFSFSVNAIDSAELWVNTKRLIPGVDYIVHPACGGEGTKGKVYPAGYGLAGEYKAAMGYTVVIKEGLPPKIEKKPEEKKKFEAFKDDYQKIGVATNLNCEGVVLLKKKLTGGFAAVPVELPVVVVQEDAWPKKARTIEFRVFRELRKIQSQNVMGYVEGSVYPDSFLIVSAHYDHLGKMGTALFTGANDNASGTSMMLSMAAHFSKPENRPRCSMLFIGFGAEEAGLIGSRYYVEKDPRVPLNRIRFLLNLDLMGNGDQGITAVAGLDFPDLFDTLKNLNTEMQAVPAVNGRNNAPNSDHFYFVKNGVRGFFIYTLGGPPHYHDVNDTPANLPMSKYFEVRELLMRFLTTIDKY